MLAFASTNPVTHSLTPPTYKGIRRTLDQDNFSLKLGQHRDCSECGMAQLQVNTGLSDLSQSRRQGEVAEQTRCLRLYGLKDVVLEFCVVTIILGAAILACAVRANLQVMRAGKATW